MFNSFDENTENSGGQKFSLYEGPLMFRPVLINPTREVLNKFLGSDKKTDEINYNGQAKVGEEDVDSLRVVFWGYLTGDDGVERKHMMDPIFLKNKEMVSFKDPNLPKYNYINPYGRNAWVDKNLNFMDYWYSGNYRKAIYGEQQLMDFIINMMGINTFYDPKASKDTLKSYITNGETYVNINSLFSRDYSSIQSLLDSFCSEESELAETNPNRMRKVTALGLVKVRNDNGEYQQSLYTGKFGRVRKSPKGEYSIVESDVNQIVKAALAEKDYLKMVGGIFNTLRKFDPTKIEEESSLDSLNDW